MNYQKIYKQLMARGKSRKIPDEVYTERHHILPRCMGGDNDPDNLVVLLPEEHFLAHLLLIKIYPKNVSLALSAHLMTVSPSPNNGRINNKGYGWLKRRFSEALKERGVFPSFGGYKHTEEAKLRISKNVKKALTELIGVKVFLYDLDGDFVKEFDTLQDAGAWLGTSPSNVKYTAEGKFKYCRGHQIRYEKFERLEPVSTKRVSRKPNEGKVYITNGIENRLILPFEVIPEGWHKGKKNKCFDSKKASTSRKKVMETRIKCEHCGKENDIFNHKRWHGEKCKFVNNGSAKV